MFHLIPDGCKIIVNLEFEKKNVFLNIFLMKWHNLEKLSKLLINICENGRWLKHLQKVL